MYHFTKRQQENALLFLCFFHIFIVAISNYLVQLPLNFLGIHSTWGSLTFPFIFLATDLTVRIFGATLARRIIFRVMVPTLFISYITSTLFFQASWQGFVSLGSFNLLVARIAIASFLAYLFGQMLDIHVFNRLRRFSTWWIAPAASAVIGNLLDTFTFFFIAFYRSNDPHMALYWVEIGIWDYLFKMLVCLLFFLPMYRVLLNFIVTRFLKIISVSSPA